MAHVAPATRLALAGGTLVLLIVITGIAAEERPVFENPNAAAAALIEAAGADDPEAVPAVLGSGSEDLGSGDPIADAAARRDFAAAAEEATRIEQDGDDLALLTVGEQEWPFPIPLVRTEAGWSFDVEAGKEELFNRRIGRNELHVIAVAREFVEAQFEYVERDRDGDGAMEFAGKLMSSDDARDGLYWPTADDEPESPMGRLVAEAVAEGYDPGAGREPQPYQGYYYRSLASQGEHAPGGAKSYLEDGRITGGFALIAYPAVYGGSGIMTFMVNHSGILFEKDLGEDTPTIAAAITAYDPDESWEPVTD